MTVYIIFAVIVALCVVFLFIMDVFVHDVDADLPKAIAVVVLMATFLIATIFYIVDFKVTRTGEEGVPVVATLVDKETRKRKGGASYYFYITCEGDATKQNVSASTYSKYKTGDRIEGEIVYFTTGITKMYKYEYKFYY